MLRPMLMLGVLLSTSCATPPPAPASGAGLASVPVGSTPTVAPAPDTSEPTDATGHAEVTVTAKPPAVPRR